MNDKQLKACVDYINKHAAALHGVKSGKLDVGSDLTVEKVVNASIQGSNAVIVADRGIKGTPKYILDLKEVEKGEAPKVSAEAAEFEAKKVDEVQRKLRGR